MSTDRPPSPVWCVKRSFTLSGKPPFETVPDPKVPQYSNEVRPASYDLTRTGVGTGWTDRLGVSTYEFVEVRKVKSRPNLRKDM